MPSPEAVVTPRTPAGIPGALWSPIAGAEAQRLVSRALPADARANVLAKSATILARGAPPSAGVCGRGGLVVGYVQSGKTLSFTTAIAMARDNGIKLVIVVAGTSVPLLSQSARRLSRDLELDASDGFLRWRTYQNPSDSENQRRQIQQALDDWNDPLARPGEIPTVLITVMKHHGHLNNLVSLLRNLNLAGVPALIVDDEADQASLNTGVNRGRQSPTYVQLLDLRQAIPNHTFLQYTATPQAPLLINIIDTLSPEFCVVLEPGPDYVGGKDFFTGSMNLVSVIPVSEIPSANNPLHDPPDHLLKALRLFLLGVAAGLNQGRSVENPNRSMLVHPSQTTDYHRDYIRWVRAAFDDWARILSLPVLDTERDDLLDLFRASHADLSRTVPDLSSFEELVEHLPRAFASTSIQEVNARRGATPQIDWATSYGWILVGGQAMDRGFTVEGLTVTYMPRGPGVRNADTVQQRGRFFGYKRSYLGFCRVYLEQAAMTAFTEYVEHEESIRDALKKVDASGGSLRDWKRVFVLSPALRPCRTNVVQFGYSRGEYSDDWHMPGILVMPPEVVDSNRELIDGFIGGLTFDEADDYGQREPSGRHLVSRRNRLSDVLGSLLVPYRVVGANDTESMLGCLLQLSKALEGNADELCTVYRISPLRTRSRGANPQGRAPLMQGRSTGKNPYPGDAAYHDPGTVTVQVHRLNVNQRGQPTIPDVPVLAVWVPSRMGRAWLAQSQSD